MSTHAVPSLEAAITAVLFDMGGVLVRLGSFETMLGPTSLAPDEISEAWILSDAVQEFEQGRCDVEFFAGRIIDEMSLQGTPDQFIERFMQLPKGLFPGAAELVETVAKVVTTGILSNTNALHWGRQKDSGVIPQLCNRLFLSYELGMAKPHRPIYDYAINDLAMPANQILFLDDNQVNVDGARVTGMRAELARGPEEAAEVLRSYNVIS